MRKTVFIFLIIFPFISFVQSDSFEQKLKQYKNLFEQGLINQNEYEAVKSDLLKINMKKQPDKKINQAELDTLNKKWRKQIGAGCILLPWQPAFKNCLTNKFKLYSKKPPRKEVFLFHLLTFVSPIQILK